MNDPKRIIIVLLGLLLVAMGVWGIKDHMDSGGYKTQVNYITAVQSHDKDDFNYIVDSQQGRVLANGDFSTIGLKQARLENMDKGYTYVKRDHEHYTMHTREDCTTDSEGHSHCTTVTYYTWDWVDSDEARADEINFYGRTYPITLFNISKYKHNTNCIDFMSAGTNGGWFGSNHGCVDGDYYIDDNDRYSYITVPPTFNSTFLAVTYGGLKPFNESSITLQDKSIQQALRDAGQYKLISFLVAIVLLFFLTLGAGFAAYAWVFEDGVWSLDR